MGIIDLLKPGSRNLRRRAAEPRRLHHHGVVSPAMGGRARQLRTVASVAACDQPR